MLCETLLGFEQSNQELQLRQLYDVLIVHREAAKCSQSLDAELYYLSKIKDLRSKYIDLLWCNVSEESLVNLYNHILNIDDTLADNKTDGKTTISKIVDHLTKQSNQIDEQLTQAQHSASPMKYNSALDLLKGIRRTPRTKITIIEPPIEPLPTVAQLPHDVWGLIIDCLSLRDRRSLRDSCRGLRAIVDSDNFELRAKAHAINVVDEVVNNKSYWAIFNYIYNKGLSGLDISEHKNWGLLRAAGIGQPDDKCSIVLAILASAGDSEALNLLRSNFVEKVVNRPTTIERVKRLLHDQGLMKFINVATLENALRGCYKKTGNKTILKDKVLVAARLLKRLDSSGALLTADQMTKAAEAYFLTSSIYNRNRAYESEIVYLERACKMFTRLFNSLPIENEEHTISTLDKADKAYSKYALESSDRITDEQRTDYRESVYIINRMIAHRMLLAKLESGVLDEFL